MGVPQNRARKRREQALGCGCGKRAPFCHTKVGFNFHDTVSMPQNVGSIHGSLPKHQAKRTSWWNRLNRISTIADQIEAFLSMQGIAINNRGGGSQTTNGSALLKRHQKQHSQLGVPLNKNEPKQRLHRSKQGYSHSTRLQSLLGKKQHNPIPLFYQPVVRLF